MSLNDVRAEIVDACHRLEAGDLVAGASGNVSVRLPPADGRELLAITPSQIPYRILRPEQILVVDLEGKLVDGDGRPSSEMRTHLAAYRARPDVGAVIHSHSVYAMALAVANQGIPALIDEQVVTLGGEVRVAEYGMSASHDLANNAMEAMGERQAVLLRNHGALGVGRDLEEVLAVVALLERIAKTYLLARTVGDIEPLPANVVEIEAKFFRMQHGLPVDK
jgi:L-fuculose-phosphate aldolase